MITTLLSSSFIAKGLKNKIYDNPKTGVLIYIPIMGTWRTYEI
jgi:hypothetical protein